jgi:hypothetical protein
LADKYDDPRRFTALIGYEWTAIGGYNLHRNVIFRCDASVANRTVPFSQYDSKNPEDLWKHLAAVEKETGGEVLAIPHNGNLSNGRMFTVETFDGKPLTKELATMRIQYEPLVEVTQIKGDGEAHPMLSPNDEFADYEKWDKSNLNGTAAKTSDMLQWDTPPSTQTGLMLEKQLGGTLQVRYGRQHGCPHRWPRSRKRTFGKNPGWSPSRTAGSMSSLRPPTPSLPSRVGSRRQAAMQGYGRPRIPARRSSMR